MCFIRKKTINELQGFSAKRKIQKSLIKILIADDEEFPYKDELIKLGYNIIYLTDINDISQVAEYHIIISDINGIGSSFKSNYGGAFVLSQIKQKYPHKQYGAYSAKTYDPELTPLLAGITIFKKDWAIEIWCDTLNTLIRKVVDPIEIWNDSRKKMIDNGLPSKDLPILEDKYVRYVLKNAHNEKSMNEFIDNMDCNSSVKEELLSVVKITKDIITIIATLC